jgi:adenosylcobinamide-phosphate synthase
MAAAAGALGVRLEKPGVYTILGDGREPTTEDITRAIRFVGMSTALSLALALMLTVGYG